MGYTACWIFRRSSVRKFGRFTEQLWPLRKHFQFRGQKAKDPSELRFVSDNVTYRQRSNQRFGRADQRKRAHHRLDRPCLWQTILKRTSAGRCCTNWLNHLKRRAHDWKRWLLSTYALLLVKTFARSNLRCH